ncbi:MAG TPA: cation:proton antiporter [Candidatus Eisenbacteria bacterium]|nr:cation:proton antiporter [Candidatus Eisenbacteria bacterium]
MDQVLIILAVSTIVLVVSHRLRIPAVIALLLTGAVLGPHGAGLVGAAGDVEQLAEIGVVLLLFTIGLEVSLDDLWRLRRSALLGGGLQLGLTVFGSMIALQLLGVPTAQAALIACIVGLSSTAVVLKVLKDRGDIETPYGRSVTGVLLFQDLAVVPMLLVLPALAGDELEISVSSRLLTSLLLLAVVIACRWFIPWALRQVVRALDREVFTLSIVVIGLAVAWLAHLAHLEPALGAFLAGVIIAESEYSHDAMGVVLPFRDVFATVFFVSIGMLFDAAFVVAQLPLVLLLSAVVIAGKGALAALGLRLAGLPLTTALPAGIALAQIGEFSFVLLQSGAKTGLLGPDLHQLLVAVAAITLGLTPLFVSISAPVTRRILGRFPIRGKGMGEGMQDHIVIVGGGAGGKQVARAARSCGIAYLIVETNPERVNQLREEAEPIRYGDAVHEPVLTAAGVERARVVVILIRDPVAARRIIVLARRLNPTLHLVVRTRYVAEIPALLSLGANQVIAEEFESAIEIFTRVLNAYLVPDTDIEGIVDEIRAAGYQMLRSPLSKPGADT